MITEQDIIAILEYNGKIIETDNYTYEAVDRAEYAKVAQEIVKKLNYEPVLATVKCNCCDTEVDPSGLVCMKCAMGGFE